MLAHGVEGDTPPLKGCFRGTKVPCSELCEGGGGCGNPVSNEIREVPHD
jgi:hypothetical protein